MNYLIVSYSHKNSDIATREKVAFIDDEKKMTFSKKLLEHENINEIMIISTCNRVEILASVCECTETLKHIFYRLSEISKMPVEILENKAEIYEDSAAIHHIFSVASSLDSVVIGETQIVGQIKDAFKISFDNGFCSQKLARVMHHTFRCAAAVRSSTKISSTPVSVSSVAVNKAKEFFGGSLAGFSAIVVGAGEMSRICAEYLIKNSVNVIIISRNIEKAQNLVNELGGTTIAEDFSRLKEFINKYRFLFSATSAKEYVIRDKMVEEVDFERYWFDIAVPRDIEDGCKEKNIKLFTVDDLKDVVSQNKTFREKQAGIAFSIIGKFTMEFYKWLQTLQVDPIIKRMRDMAKKSAQKELDRALKKGYLPKEQKEEVEKILHQAFNSFLHKPTQNLKKIAKDPEFDTIVQSFQYLFDINESQRKAINMYKCEYYMEQDVSNPPYKSKES
jgi:glutamyl-tRNA reductase